jgi:hypothetical protein
LEQQQQQRLQKQQQKTKLSASTETTTTLAKSLTNSMGDEDDVVDVYQIQTHHLLVYYNEPYLLLSFNFK